MNLKRSHRFMIAFVALFMFISLIQDSYAKYLTNATANTNMTVARWSIKINNSDITSSGDFSNTIVPVFAGNTHIASDIVAPLSEGYFDIAIDFTNVDVSFDQSISVKHATSNTISDLIITGYSIDGGTTITSVGSSTALIEKSVLLSQVQRTVTYRIYVKWVDGIGETMNNASDTQATKTGNASLDVNVLFTQKAN